MTEMTKTLTYPEFTPGRGGLPPYLAGRHSEQQYLQGALKRLQQSEGAYRDIIVIGPRGNGKTALLRWFENECAHDNKLDVVWLTPDDIPDLDTLAARCAPPSRWQKLLPDAAELGLRVVNLKWQISHNPGGLTDLLTQRCQRRPLALLLDEAHTLDVEVGRVLLNVSQKVSAKVPFLLALAGTPGLEYQINRMSATFWSRSEILGIERLDNVSARAALLEPFEQHGISIADSILDEIIDDSQRYPYFLQCWGEALTTALRSHETNNNFTRQIDEAIAVQARPAFEKKRLTHYGIFRRQIEQAGLQPLAAAVTRAYGDADTLDENKLDAVIKAMLNQDLPTGPEPTHEAIMTQREALARFGYVWEPPAAVAVWHAGVPSLMQHVLRVEEQGMDVQKRQSPH